MSSIGTGYDLAASTFSPDGRIFQVEYAQKAVDSGVTVIGLRGADAVVTAVEKVVESKLYSPEAKCRLANVNEYLGVAIAGLYPDGQALIDYAVHEALDYLKDNRSAISVKTLAQQMAEWVHIYTLGISRPFGSSLFISGYNSKPQLYVVEPSGLYYEYEAWAVGKNRQAAKTEIEKLKLADMKLDDLIREAARILITVRDDSKEKVRIEMAAVGRETGLRHKLINRSTIEAAEEWAKEQIAEEEDMED